MLAKLAADQLKPEMRRTESGARPKSARPAVSASGT